jgi:alpha-mannosidase
MEPRHLVIVPHTHWDREWYMPFERFRKRLVQMVDHLLEVLENDRKFTCFELDGQTIVLDDYLAIRPENRRRLEKLIRQERILVGPWYVQPDEFLVSGESLIRNLRLGIQSAKEFGKVSLVGYMPDQFGHISQMPQILSGFGIRSAIIWRGVGRTVNETQFLWEAPDGTQLFTIYLADSYGNGALLPLKPKELRERLERLIKRLEPYSAIKSLLLMNGLDHLEPQDGLPTQLERAVSKLKNVTFEIGSFAGFIAQAHKQSNSLTVHHGEFRSPERAPLLPGVTSSRVRQKQRAFFCSRLLEKYVEPLSAWAALCGDNRPYMNFIEHAWRLNLQNQPHDSICGCSVDNVHQEMESRFDRAEQVGKTLQKDALSFLANSIDSRWADPENPVLCVYNPTSARSQLVEVEVDLEEPDFFHSLKDSQGNILPLQKEVGERELFVQAEETPETVRQMVSAMETRELIGYYINNVFWKLDGNILRLNLLMGRSLAGEIDFQKRRGELLEALRNPAITKVEIRGISGAKTTVRFFSNNLPSHGLVTYALSGEQQSDIRANSLRASEKELENEFYQIIINADGSLNVLDKQSHKKFKCLRFVDEGDRGDTYNFDNVPDGKVVDAPMKPVVVSVIDNGPVRAAILLEGVYRIPQKLSQERNTRSAVVIETTIKTTVSVYRGIKRIDFSVSVENEAEDHRLRVLFNAPLNVTGANIETTFGTVCRDLPAQSADGFLEKPIGTSPQKTFTCIEDGSLGMAAFNRGIPEIEAVPEEQGTALALTLIRSVGWLSRDDLVSRPLAAGPQIKTPGAQSKGPHCFEFAFTSYSGNSIDAGIVEQAHAYAFPPIATMTNRHGGKLRNGVSLFESDNSNIAVTAVEPSNEKRAYLVRVYNATGSYQNAQLAFWGGKKVIHEVNFLEKKTAKQPLKTSAGKVQLGFRPAEIKTLLVRLK